MLRTIPETCLSLSLFLAPSPSGIGFTELFGSDWALDMLPLGNHFFPSWARRSGQLHVENVTKTFESLGWFKGKPGKIRIPWVSCRCLTHFFPYPVSNMWVMPVAPALAFGAKSYGRSPPEHTEMYINSYTDTHHCVCMCMHVYALRILFYSFISMWHIWRTKLKPRFHLTWFYAKFSPKSVKTCQNIRIYQDARIPQSQPKTIVSWWKPLETHRFHQTKMESRHVPTLFQNPWWLGWLWWLCSELRKAPNTIQIHEARGFTQRSSTCWQLLAAENPTFLGDLWVWSRCPASKIF